MQDIASKVPIRCMATSKKLLDYCLVWPVSRILLLAVKTMQLMGIFTRA